MNERKCGCGERRLSPQQPSPWYVTGIYPCSVYQQDWALLSLAPKHSLCQETWLCPPLAKGQGENEGSYPWYTKNHIKNYEHQQLRPLPEKLPTERRCAFSKLMG